MKQESCSASYTQSDMQHHKDKSEHGVITIKYTSDWIKQAERIHKKGMDKIMNVNG